MNNRVRKQDHYQTFKMSQYLSLLMESETEDGRLPAGMTGA
ncbi:hypothetical protein [Jeotgalibacillus proteolyticus]